MADITAKEKKRLYDKEYKAKRKRDNPEKAKRQQDKDYSARKERFKQNPAKYLWSVAKVRAKQKGIPFSIEADDIEIPKTCPIGGEELIKATGYAPNAMSLDRLNPSLGYVKGNVFVVSRIWNMKKSNMGIEDLEKIINYIKLKTT